VVVGAEAVVSALHDAAGVADAVEKAEAALRVDELAVNDLDAAWEVLELGAGLAYACDLLQRLVVALDGDGLGGGLELELDVEGEGLAPATATEIC